MDRSREARRAAAMVTSNGLPRRRHRTSSLRDSPEDDAPLELQEPARLRDRTGKKERDREKERDRDRSERERSNRTKRRRGDKYFHGGCHRDDAGDGSSEEESVNDEDEEDPDDSSVRYVTPPTNPVPLSSSSSPSSALTNHRKSYPPPTKVLLVASTWKAADEMIGVSVPRKARSASTKRSHDYWTSGVSAETIHRQASASPVRPNMVGGSSVVGSPLSAPMSPCSSSMSSVKKKTANGPKQRPPKTVSKSPSATQDDIEFEVAEVLYGLRQSQASSKQEVTSNDSARFDSREVNKSLSESKSRVSSPISNSGSVPVQNLPAMPQNSSSSQPSLSVVAPKRKRPRPVSQPEENPTVFAARRCPISTNSKTEPDLLSKQEVPSPTTEKNPDSAVQNGGVAFNSVNISSSREARPEPFKLEKEEKSSVAEQSRSKEAVMEKVEEAPSPKREYVEGRVDSAISQAIPATGGKECRREEKFEIDLMAPPPQSRLSPERVVEINHHNVQQEVVHMALDREAELTKAKPVEDEKGGKPISIGNDEGSAEETKAKSIPLDEGEAPKLNLNSKARSIDLQIDLEKVDKIGASAGADNIKLNELQPKPPPAKTPRDDASADKTAQPCSIPLSMSVPPGWPAGLPSMGYVAPLQGVVSMDGTPMTHAAIQPSSFIFTQPPPRRCGYHCYIAKNIQNHQQFIKNYPFWPAPATGNSLFSAKPYNLNMVPPADMHANAGGRSGVVSSIQDKGQALAFFPGQTASKDKSVPAANVVDSTQKKQFFLQQSLPPGAPGNILHGPAFIFPLGQQQSAAAANASAHANSASKSSMPAGSAVNLACTSNSALSASATAGQASPALSFNFPNMPTNETQYLAILGNSPYPFPIPTHVGAAPPYRGANPQAMPFFNGSFYPSQILHPPQLQQQQQQQQQPSSQSVQIQQQGHQNPSISSASSSSQKQMQNQQQRPQGSSATNGGSTNPSLQPFPAPKTRALQAQQQHEMGCEESPSTADSHVSRPPLNMGVYSQNFTLPFNPQNFALLAPPAALSVPTNASSNSNHGDKKQPQQPTQPQQASLKAGIESLPPQQAFAMSFSSINGATTSGLDLSSLAQNHAILQSLPEPARHGYHFMTAAAAAQQKKSSTYRGGPEDGKPNDSASSVEDERKSMGSNRAVSATSLGHSITFSRPDLVESSVTNNVVDSSARNLNLVPGPARSRSSVPNVPNTVASVSEPHHHQQLLQLQKQQQFAAAAGRSKNPPTSNGSVFSEHQQLLPSHSMAAKFPNVLSGFSPSLVHQSSNSPVQSPQWKGSGRTGPSHVSSPSLAGATTTSSTMKSLSQQQASRNPQQGQQTQMSFSGGGNLKASSSTSSQSQQQVPTGCQTQSSPLLVGSPSTTSLSKGATGSLRTTTSPSTGNKSASQPSALSAHHGKNSLPSLPGQKSSPVVGRNSSSLLGSPHIQSSSISVGSKTQLQQSQLQIQQPQLSKQSIQRAQLFFSSPPCMQPSAASSGQSTSGGFYLQRHRPEQQQQQQPSQVPQQPTKSQVGPISTSSSSGMLPLCPVSLATSTSTSDPAKAVAAAASNMKGQGILHVPQFAASQASGGVHHQLFPAGFPYLHAVPAAGSAAVQVKPAEQKQPAGNDNLHASWQPEKKL